jgi:Fur family peroxide stress response transcriptional regulator
MGARRVQTQAGAVALLRQAGLRVTPQRLAVADAVLVGRHPTAAEIYATLLPQFPSMGLATVYTTLNSMAARNLVRILPFQDAVRYDANMTPHANLVCTECGRIDDLDDCVDLVETLRQRAADQASFTLGQVRFDLSGMCSTCHQQFLRTSRSIEGDASDAQ